MNPGVGSCVCRLCTGDDSDDSDEEDAEILNHVADIVAVPYPVRKVDAILSKWRPARYFTNIRNAGTRESSRM